MTQPNCDKEYDHWGYFWAALFAVMATVIYFFGKPSPTPPMAAPVQTIAPAQTVAPVQTVTQTAAPINITVVTTPPAPRVKLRPTVIHRYVKTVKVVKVVKKPKHHVHKKKKHPRPHYHYYYDRGCYTCGRW